MFVHKIRYTLQKHVKTTKTDKTRFSLPPNKQSLLDVPFQSTKYRNKDLCVDNKVRKTILDVICPKCGNEKYVDISNNKTTSF